MSFRPLSAVGWVLCGVFCVTTVSLILAWPESDSALAGHRQVKNEVRHSQSATAKPGVEQRNIRSDKSPKFDATFSGGKGTRLDFAPQSGGLRASDDNSSYLYRVIIPETGTKANVVLLYQGKSSEAADAGEPELYEVEILQRSEEMIVMRMRLESGEAIDRFQLYTIYPKKGMGYCVTLSAYINGSEKMKALAAIDPEIPVASANIVSFFRLD